MPRICAKAISTRNPERNAKNNLLFDGIAIAQYILINSSHSGA